MSFFKVLGGVAAGIGVVAAAPVFGAVGAVSLVGAGVGAVAGGVAGSVIAASDDEELDYVRNERNQVLEENTVYSEKMKEVEKYIKKMMASNIEKTKKIKVIKTLLEAGLLMAWADGSLEDEEKEELIHLLEQFPEYEEYLNKPIEKEKVFESIKEIKTIITLNSILSIMYTVGNSDDDFSDEEQNLYMETKNYVELLEETSNKELLKVDSIAVKNEEVSTKKMKNMSKDIKKGEIGPLEKIIQEHLNEYKNKSFKEVKNLKLVIDRINIEYCKTKEEVKRKLKEGSAVTIDPSEGNYLYFSRNNAAIYLLRIIPDLQALANSYSIVVSNNLFLGKEIDMKSADLLIDNYLAWIEEKRRKEEEKLIEAKRKEQEELDRLKQIAEEKLKKEKALDDWFTM